jgi:protein ImuA
LLRAAHVEDALRAAADALTCTALGAVVVEIVGTSKALDLKAARRLTLLAGETGVSVLLLRFSAAPDSSSAETRWLVRGAPSGDDENWGGPVFAARLLRNRHGSTGQWVMEWNCDEGGFRAAPGGAVVPAARDRPAAAPPQEPGTGRAVA